MPGMYELHLNLTITAHTHRCCLDLTKRFKNLAAAFDFGHFTISENKSARKGDVLTRNLAITMYDYPSAVILFREAVDRIVEACNIWYVNCATVQLYHASAVSIDKRADLL